MAQELNTPAQYQTILDSYENLLFDCDGVVWEGSTLIPHVDKVLKHFRSLGKRIFFVTNNATKSRASNKAKFDQMGIQCEVVRSVILVRGEEELTGYI